MPRSKWKWIASLAVSVLLVLATGAAPEPQAAAQDAPDTRAELMDPLRSDVLTREQLAGLYRSLALGQLPGEFEPPACVEGEEMFTDVPASSLFCSWIEEMARRGITAGCTATEFCPGDPVSRGQMAKFVVAAVADEAPHVVGEPGEPAFGDGGEGDCLWRNAQSDINTTMYWLDSDEIVHLSGVAMADDGPGGDGLCDSPTNDISDHVIFELPTGYQPEQLKIFPMFRPTGPGTGTGFIAPEGGMMFDGEFLPGGTVFLESIPLLEAPSILLDGISFRAAPTAPQAGGFAPPTCVEGEEMFTDVPASSLFCPWIEEMARRGVTSGCTATRYCPGNPVSRAQMAAFEVGAVADEDFHVVGEPGEPAFGDGGEGDCLWQNALDEVNPVSFYKDSDGIVHLAGLATVVDGIFGDMTCNEVNEISDRVIFELPAGYRPEHLKLFPSAELSEGSGITLIVPEGGLVVGEEFVRPGAVLWGTPFLFDPSDSFAGGLDPISFREPFAPPGPSRSREPARVSLQALRDLLD